VSHWHPNMTSAQLAAISTVIVDFDPHVIDLYDFYLLEDEAARIAARQLIVDGLMTYVTPAHGEVMWTPQGFNLAHVGGSPLRRAIEASRNYDAQLHQGTRLIILGFDHFTKKYLVSMTHADPAVKMGFEVEHLEFASSVAVALYFLRTWGVAVSVDDAWEPVQRRTEGDQGVSA
jgi:hypothetical protein